MGGAVVKFAGLPMAVILKRLDECLIPDDREPILNFLEMLEVKLGGVFASKKATTQFHVALGIQIVLKIVKRMMNDEVVLRMAINIFDLQRSNSVVIMDFVKYGGFELFSKIQEEHADDPYIMAQLPAFMKSVLVTGAQAAIEEIEHEAMSLQLCQKCQETVERARRVNTSSTTTKIPKSSERVNRVLMFMSNYPDRVEVVKTGLDALIYYSRNADSKESIQETSLVSSVSQIITHFKSTPDIIWRCFLCLHLTAASNGSVATVPQFLRYVDELAYEMTRYEVHEVMAEIYSNFEEPRIQQQMLWLLDLMIANVRSKQRVHMSEKCVAMIKSIIDKREFLINQIGTSVKERFVPYKVVVPLSIRIFYREIGGKYLISAPTDEQKQQRPIAPRKKFGRAPMYGTVDTVHFNKGEEGLV